MSASGQTLKEIHRLRKQAQELSTQIEQAPRRLKTQEAKLAKQEENLRLAQEGIKQLKVQMHDKETSIKGIQTTIKKHEKQFDEASNKKEYDALKTEIANEKKSITALEDEILDIMGKIEESTAALPELDKALQKARNDFAQYKTDQEERLVRFAGEKKQVLEDLKKVEENLPENIRIVYDREVNSRGEDALAAVENRICEAACYTEITFQMYNELGRGHFICCKSCGRVLYLPE